MPEKKKALKILNELLNYFFSQQANDIRMGIDFVPKGFFIEIQGNVSKKPEDLENFSTLLTVERDPDVDEYFDSVIDDNHHEENDYLFLGQLIDDVEVAYEAPLLVVKVFRENLLKTHE